ncbi:MAG: type 1 glutamine amidotransferase [Gammaproteobacteria bacterium]|nr:type 1 glutamine amidotransferase [Gammaproteobacteria bacterium]
MTNIHYFQHVPFEGPGSLEIWAKNNGHQTSATRFYENDPLPSVNDIDWLTVMGGPMSIHDTADYPWLIEEKKFIKQAIDSGKTVLGICLGAQLIADALGASVYPNQEKEIGWFPVEKTPDLQTAVARILPDTLEVFHWHGETFELPRGAVHLAKSAVCENQAFIYKERVLGFQFHLETTPDSAKALIAHCANELTDAPYIQTAAEMLANEARFSKINATMNNILEMIHKVI